MEKKTSKYISLNREEYFLLIKCSTFAMTVFDAAAKIHMDFAKVLSEYVSLSIELKNEQTKMTVDVSPTYHLKEEYFGVSARVITLTLSHLSVMRYHDYVYALHKLRSKIKKEGK